MSGHWHKVVSGACKPKHAVPKSKYLEPLIGCTYNSDGSFADVTRSLSLRLRDPSPTIAFKSLLVMHTLIRQGNLEEVFPYWSGSDGKDGSRSLGLLGWVNAAASGAMDTPKNFVRYGHYLGARLKCYAALKHDPIRTRAEAPASLRRSVGAGAGAHGTNRLRTLTVEKGLLREVMTLQKLLDSLIECKFAPEDTNDELIVMALRMLVKDLLILFQAVNEGVINVLEHYFEMSKVDATASLKTYKIFCRQCEKVVAYLGVAKSLAGVLNVNIPNLRHAPVSLAGSLQEYLDDPNFEKNREEYRQSKLVADGKQPAPKEAPKEPAASTSTSAAPVPVSTPADSAPKPSFQDFFASIESEQQSMFNPQTGSPTFGQNSSYNPFTGQPVAPLAMTQSPSYGSMLFAQQTGMMPATSMGQGFAPPVQVQQTGFAMGGQMGMTSNGVPAQMTGHNPFRQSMMSPLSSAAPPMMVPQQATGNQFGLQQPSMTGGAGHNPFRQSTAGFPPAFTGAQPPPNRANGAMSAPPPSLPDPFSSFGAASSPSPSPSPFPSASSPAPMLAQPTGSRNPFAPPPGSAPPVPPVPTAGQGGPSLNTLAMSAWQRDAKEAQVRQEAARLQAEQAAAKQKQAESLSPATNGTAKQANDGSAAFADFFSTQIGRLEGGGKNVQQAQKTGGGGLFSNIASEFATTRPKAEPAPSSSSAAESAFPFLSPTGSLVPQTTGSISPFGAPGGQRTSSPGPMQPQATGFGGSLVKPFKPSSSFGTSLASALPPLQEEAPPMPPFATGAGGPNPFRASTLSPSVTGLGDNSPARRGTLAGFAPGLVSQPTGYPGALAQQQQQHPTLTSNPTGFGGIKPFQPTSSFGQSSFSSAPTNGIQTSAPPPVSLI